MFRPVQLQRQTPTPPLNGGVACSAVRSSGFTLPEVIGVVVVSSVLFVALINFGAAVMSATRLPVINQAVIAMPASVGVGTLGAETFTAGTLAAVPPQYTPPSQWNQFGQAPTFNGLRMAADVMKAFQDSAHKADCVLVIGGVAATPTPKQAGLGSSQAFVTTTTNGYWAGMTTLPLVADPRALTYGYDFRLLSSGQDLRNAIPAAALNATDDPADFTVVCIQGLNTVLSVTECRRVASGTSAFYAVTHYGYPSAPGVLYGYYRFYLNTAPINEDVWQIPIGAQHYWYRSATTMRRIEEGPCRLVFPDPYILSSQDSSTGFFSFSRFVYFVDPVSP